MPDWWYAYLDGQSPAEHSFQLVVLLVALLFVAWKSYRSYHHRRFIQDTPTSRVASAAQGYVELKGLGEYLPDGNTRSPFSDRRCLWYHCRVEVRRQRGSRSYWSEESDERSDDLFVLRDETGDCVVIPDGAEVIPAQKRVWYGAGPAASRHSGGRSNRWLGMVLGIGRYRFTEELILVADQLYVIGQFESKQLALDPQTLEQQAADLVKHWKIQPQRFLAAFDLNKDKRIDADEWKLVRQHARQQVEQKYQTRTMHLIRKPGEQRQPFLISCQDEETLLKKNRVLVVIYLALFFILLYLSLNLLDYILAT